MIFVPKWPWPLQQAHAGHYMKTNFYKNHLNFMQGLLKHPRYMYLAELWCEHKSKLMIVVGYHAFMLEDIKQAFYYAYMYALLKTISTTGQNSCSNQYVWFHGCWKEHCMLVLHWKYSWLLPFCLFLCLTCFAVFLHP